MGLEELASESTHRSTASNTLSTRAGGESHCRRGASEHADREGTGSAALCLRRTAASVLVSSLAEVRDGETGRTGPAGSRAFTPTEADP